MALYLHHAELVGRQAREAATCAFIIYKRMNIKDYDGKPSRIFKNSRFALKVKWQHFLKISASLIIHFNSNYEA